MKRVIFLRSNSVNPDSRVEKETNSLIGNDYEVTILCWDRDNRNKGSLEFLNLANGKVPIIRFGILAKYGAGIKSVVPFLIFQYRLMVWMAVNRKKYEVIHASDYDTAIVAFIAAKLFRKKLIFDIFDFLFSKPEGRLVLFKKIIKDVQLKVIDEADYTIICTEKRIEQIHGSHPKKVKVIHNSPPSVSNQLLKLSLNPNKVKIVYVGIFQDRRFLIELAEVITEMKDVELHIGGFGKYETYFQELSEKADNIFYYGKLSYMETLALENSCDIMTAIYDPNFDNHYFAAPNKFYEALMLGKPLIMVKNTGMAEIVERYDVGVVIPYSKEGLKQGIEQLVARQYEWARMSGKMKEIYSNQFSWGEMERRLLEVYDEI